MAHKRMFSKDITGSDAFREMPASSQALYFHLGMEADDDGFLDNYKSLMRSIGGSEDDLKILLAKRFLILFPSKIIVVKHWLINNTVRTDRYKETKHLDEKRALIVKENGAYTEDSKLGIPSGNHLATQYRIGEDRIIGEALLRIETVNSEEEPKLPKKETRSKDKESVYKLFSSKEQPWWRHKQQKVAALSLFDLVGVTSVERGLKVMRENESDQYCPQAATPFEYESKREALIRFMKRNNITA